MIESVQNTKFWWIFGGANGGAARHPRAHGAPVPDHGGPLMCSGPPKMSITGRTGCYGAAVFQKCPGTKVSVPGKNWGKSAGGAGCSGENTYKKLLHFWNFDHF